MDRTNDQYNEIDLMTYVDRFYRAFKRLWMFALLFMLIGLTFFEAKEVLFFRTTYTSEAVFVPSTSIEEVYDYESGNGGNTVIKMFNSLMTGDEMATILRRALNKQTIPATITISQVRSTNLVSLKCTASNPEDAYEVAEAIVNNYGSITSKTMSDVSIRLLESPNMPTNVDAHPNYIHSGLKGLMYGAVVGLVIMVISMLMRKTVLNKNDVKQLLGAKCIATVPYIPKSRRSNSTGRLLLSNVGLSNGYHHSFHDIRIHIERDKKENDHNVIMFTSAVPNEGKTITAINTAISLSQKNYKTILVDLDLRNPSIHSVFFSRNTESVVLKVLNREASLQESVAHYNDYLDVLYGGTGINDDATEILSRGSLKAMIEALKNYYDFVVIDVPPIYLMEDTLMIGRLVDSAVIVVKQDYVESSNIAEVMDELSANRDIVTGVVLNSVKTSLIDNVTSGGYGYGYGYGYGER